MQQKIIKNKWSRGDLTYLEKCPSCGQNIDYAPIYKRHDDENLMPDEWNIYNCIHCRSFFL